MSPRVSIGLPVFNDEATLRLALASVFAQSMADWELLIIDDGSTDGSLEMARAVDDERVTVIADGANLGLAARLNQLTRASRAPVIARMDADDAMMPHRLARQLGRLDADPELDLVASRALLMTMQERVYGMTPDPELSGEAGLFLLHSLVFVHPSVMARRAWMLRHPYDETFRKAQDRELWARTHAVSRFAKIHEPLLFYREAGKATLATYLATKRTDRRILRRYGRTQLGVGAGLRQFGETFAKAGAYAGADVLGLRTRFDTAVAVKRARDLAVPAVDRAQRLLDEVGQTRVPGLD